MRLGHFQGYLYEQTLVIVSPTIIINRVEARGPNRGRNKGQGEYAREKHHFRILNGSYSQISQRKWPEPNEGARYIINNLVQ